MFKIPVIQAPVGEDSKNREVIHKEIIARTDPKLTKIIMPHIEKALRLNPKQINTKVTTLNHIITLTAAKVKMSIKRAHISKEQKTRPVFNKIQKAR